LCPDAAPEGDQDEKDFGVVGFGVWKTKVVLIQHHLKNSSSSSTIVWTMTVQSH
jgi:hypothetical protein